MIQDFKEFAVRGNVMDMAVGIIIGAAFGAIVQSLVNDVLMPPVGLALGGVDFADLFFVLREGAEAGPYLTLEAAREAGAVTMNYGLFFNALLSFLIVAFAVFAMVRYMNRLQRPVDAPEPAVPSVKTCDYCASEIPLEASRCPHCTSQLAAT